MARRKENQSEQEPKAELEFNQVPSREVKLPPPPGEIGGGANLPRTSTEAIESQSDKTDMQYVASELSPNLGTKVQNAAMVSRVDPNIFLSRLHLNAVDDIMHQDPTKAIDVNEIWQKHEILLSIGLDGMHIIDLLELAGAAREEKNAKDRLSLLGGS